MPIRVAVNLSARQFRQKELVETVSSLKRFPLDKLKIDRSFIRDVVHSSEDASIVRAVVSLAHNLKLKVIAEGVETREQLDFLRELGCDQYQGYYFSPPLAPQDFYAWLGTRQLELKGLTEADLLKTHSRLSLLALRMKFT